MSDRMYCSTVKGAPFVRRTVHIFGTPPREKLFNNLYGIHTVIYTKIYVVYKQLRY